MITFIWCTAVQTVVFLQISGMMRELPRYMKLYFLIRLFWICLNDLEKGLGRR